MFWLGLLVGLVLGGIVALLVYKNNKNKAEALAVALNEKIAKAEAEIKAKLSK